uniref:Uncharacterized protein n=1 Tax=Astyanax mexicanus TaxID=7994 RepID=A0A8B9HVZ6_ASTMX
LYATPGATFQSKSTQKQPETPAGPVSTLKDGQLAISIHAKPGAKQNAVTGWLANLNYRYFFTCSPCLVKSS